MKTQYFETFLMYIFHKSAIIIIVHFHLLFNGFLCVYITLFNQCIIANVTHQSKEQEARTAVYL